MIELNANTVEESLQHKLQKDICLFVSNSRRRTKIRNFDKHKDNKSKVFRKNDGKVST